MIKGKTPTEFYPSSLHALAGYILYTLPTNSDHVQQSLISSLQSKPTFLGKALICIQNTKTHRPMLQVSQCHKFLVLMQLSAETTCSQ